MQEEQKRPFYKDRAFILTAMGLILFAFVIAKIRSVLLVWSMFLSILTPILIGLGLAYLMNPIMMGFERIMSGKIRRGTEPLREKRLRRFIRTIAAVLALLVIATALTGFALIVLPQFIETVQYLLTHLYEKLIGVIDWADEVTRYRFADVMERTRTD